MLPTDDTETSRDRLADVVGAVDSAQHRFWVEVAGESVSVLSDSRDAQAACDHIFSLQARVSAVTGNQAGASVWTIAVLASEYLHQACGKLASLAIPDAGTGSANHTATYWREGHDAERVVGSPELTMVRHFQPFRGLTLFLPERKLVLYVRLPSERLYLPHLEHLITYAVRVGCWRRGCMDAHAALLQYRNQGLALSGPRRAGKTSLAMHLLARGAELLGSDMGELSMARGARVRAEAVPHVCRITRETVVDNPQLDSALGSLLESNYDYLAGPVFSSGKLELYAPALDHVFRRRLHIASMYIDAIVFPKFSLEVRRQRITVLDPKQGMKRLLRSLETDRPLVDWLPFPEVIEREALQAVAKQQLARSPLCAFELEFGRSPSLNWQEVDALIDSL